MSVGVLNASMSGCDRVLTKPEAVELKGQVIGHTESGDEILQDVRVSRQHIQSVMNGGESLFDRIVPLHEDYPAVPDGQQLSGNQTIEKRADGWYITDTLVDLPLDALKDRKRGEIEQQLLDIIGAGLMFTMDGVERMYPLSRDDQMNYIALRTKAESDGAFVMPIPCAESVDITTVEDSATVVMQSWSDVPHDAAAIIDMTDQALTLVATTKAVRRARMAALESAQTAEEVAAV